MDCRVLYRRSIGRRWLPLLLIIPTLVLLSAPRAISAAGSAVFAVTNVPPSAGIGVPFTAQIELSDSPPGSGLPTWAGYSMDLSYDTSVLKVDSIAAGGLAGCVPPSFWLETIQSGTDNVLTGCFGQSSTVTGISDLISFECIATGTTTLHLVTPTENPAGTTLFDVNALSIPTTTVDATITCAVPHSNILDAAGNDVTSQHADPGTSVRAQFTLDASATGTVNFRRYGDSFVCGGTETDENNVPLVGGVAQSALFTAAAGSVSYRAHYNGDGSHPAFDDVCVGVLVAFTPSLDVHIVDDGGNDVTGRIVGIGTGIHATATATGTQGAPTGSLLFRRYTGLTCGGTEIDDASVAAPSGNSSVFRTVADMSYRVHYSGDNTYLGADSACVALPANSMPLLLEIANVVGTPLSAPPAAGTAVHAHAALLSSSAPSPGGTVDFQRYASPDCSGPAAAQLNVAVGAGVADSAPLPSDGTTALSYRLHYDGDAAYAPRDVGCVSLAGTTLAVTDVPPSTNVGFSFTAHLDLVSLESDGQGFWGGYQTQVSFDTPILGFQRAAPGGLAGCTPPNWQLGTPQNGNPITGCIFQNSQATGTADLLTFYCLAPGVAHIHLVTLAEDSVEGTQLFDPNALNIPVHTVDATATCLPPLINIDANPNNGGGPCRVMDTSADVVAGSSFWVALCYSDSPKSSIDLGIEYDSTLTPAVSDPGTDPANVDGNPDLNDGAPQSDVGPNWDCSVGGVNPPSAADPATLHCSGTGTAGIAPVEIASLTFEAPTTGTEQLSFDTTQTAVDGQACFAPGCAPVTIRILDGSADPDGDGRTTAAEIAAGTNPLCAGSPANVGVADAAGDCETDAAFPGVVGDGCSDAQDTRLGLAGSSPWDFYTVPVPALTIDPNAHRDAVVNASDAQAIFGIFKLGSAFNYNGDLNGNGVKDGWEYDRSFGAAPYGTAAPDGVISSTDAQRAFAQFRAGYSCTSGYDLRY